MHIQNKVFVVTGAGGGIGGETALKLLDRGAKVAAVDLKDEGLNRLKERAGDKADNLSLHTLSISDRQAVSALPKAVMQAHGQVDGLLNVAGIIQPFVKINNLDYDAIERVMNVNFYGTLYMTKAFLPYLLERPEAHIVNVSSMGGFLPVPGQAVYGASKAAVKLMTEGLYAELLDTPVGVTVVFPGATNTNITKNSNVKAPDVKDADMAKMAAKTLPADEAAEQIVRGLEAGKLYVYTGSDSKTMNTLYRLAPRYATRLIAKKMKSLLSADSGQPGQEAKTGTAGA